jgi:hypothetical protein
LCAAFPSFNAAGQRFVKEGVRLVLYKMDIADESSIGLNGVFLLRATKPICTKLLFNDTNFSDFR